MTTGSVCAISPHQAATPVRAPGRRSVRRRISPQAGHALEILGHAIEYLADEYAYRVESDLVYDGRVEAMQMLMRANRQIYLDCPQAPSIADRWRSFLRARVSSVQ